MNGIHLLKALVIFYSLILILYLSGKFKSNTIHFLYVQEETPDDDETYNVVNSLKKVAIFYSCHNLGNWSIWSSLFKDVEEAKDGVTSLPEEVRKKRKSCNEYSLLMLLKIFDTEVIGLQAVKYCMSACYFAVLWDLHHIEEIMEGGGPTEDIIVEVKSKLSLLMDVMKMMLIQQHSQIYKEEVLIFINVIFFSLLSRLLGNPLFFIF